MDLDSQNYDNILLKVLLWWPLQMLLRVPIENIFLAKKAMILQVQVFTKFSLNMPKHKGKFQIVD